MERRGIYEKIIPIVALIGMMSLGIQEMNVKAETYKSAGSKMDFWNSEKEVPPAFRKKSTLSKHDKKSQFYPIKSKLALLLITYFTRNFICSVLIFQ